ncbi:MAG: hypothetical protein HY329_25195, partial [Chloroflexi bacterium]|nr:hypothetical protein [Chloroflexota bacterium]
MIDRIGVVFRKELVDNLRDRRSLAAALLYPLFGPVMLAGLFFMLDRVYTGEAAKLLTLAVAGA